ncbi:MAG: DMT family transporter [Pseudomonadota bacterium]
MAQSEPNRDNPRLGIALMLAFCAVIPFSDALAKMLGDRIPLLQLIQIRFAAQLLLFLPLALWLGHALFPSRRAVVLVFARTVLQIGGLAAMFTALRFLPLADAVAIAFVMPFIVLLLGHWFLHEEVGPRRLIACVVGFAGTLMVTQPSFAQVGWPALLPLAVAVIFALFTLVTRAISRDMTPIALQASSSLFGLPLLLPLIFFAVPGSPPPLSWVIPEGIDLWLWVLLGFTGAFGHWLMTASLRFAPASTLAPMQYLEIPFATLLGWAFFRDLPNGLATAGIAVTLAAGLYIVLRERRVSAGAV